MQRTDPTDSESSRFEFDIERLKGIADAPFNFLRFSLWWIRKTFFTRPRSKTDSLVVSRSKPEIKELFGRHYFEPGWETSYQYRNEILNYRRVEYDADREPPLEWWQVHIRGYAHPPGSGRTSSKVELTAHYEPEPVEHPDAHVSKNHIVLDRGMEAMRAVLDENDVEYELVPAGE